MFRITRNESPLLQLRENVDQVMLVRKLLDIADNLRRSQVGQGIFDPTQETRNWSMISGRGDNP